MNKNVINTCAPIIFRTFTADPRPEVQQGSRYDSKNEDNFENAKNSTKNSRSKDINNLDVSNTKKANSQNKTSLFNDNVNVTHRRRKR